MPESDESQLPVGPVTAWLGRHPWVKTGGALGATLFVGVIIGLSVSGVLDEASYTADGGFSLTTREVDDPTFLRTIWEDEDRKEAFIALLATRGFFQASDTNLVPAIVGLCDEIPNEPLDAYLAAAQRCAEEPVPAALRELARRSRPPFHFSGKPVRIGVPSEGDQPLVGRANVCRNGDWYRETVVLTNPDDGREVEVHAGGHYGLGICGPQVGTADFQLNEADALSILDGPLAKLEDAIAVIVN